MRRASGRWTRWLTLVAVAVACAAAAAPPPGAPGASTEPGGGAPPTTATTPDAGAGRAAVVGPIPTDSVLEQAESVAARVRELRQQIEAGDPTATVEADFRVATPELERLTVDLHRELARDSTVRTIEDLRGRWTRVSLDLAEWSKAMAARAKLLGDALAELTGLAQRWDATREALASEALPAAVLERVDATRLMLRTGAERVRVERERLLTVQAGIAARQAEVGERLAEIDAAAAALRRSLLGRQAGPLWSDLAESGLVPSAAPDLREGRQREWGELVRFVELHAERLAWHGFCGLLVLLLVLEVRRRSVRWPAGDPALEPARRLVSRPVSATVLLTLLATPLVYDALPIEGRRLASLMAIVPLLRLVDGKRDPIFRSLLILMIAQLLVAGFRDLLPPFSPAARLVLVAQAVAGVAWVAWTFRAARLRALAAPPPRWFVLTACAGAALLMTGIVAAVVGAVRFASVLVEGTITSAAAALVFRTGSRVLDGLVVGILRLHPVRSTEAIGRRLPELRRRGMRAVHALMFLSWLALSLSVFAVLVPLVQALRALRDAPLTIGAFAFTVGGVLRFAVTVVVSYYVARAVRALLEDDVLPRLDLPRGVPSAVSAGVNYLLLFAGFLLALASAGIGFDRIALVVSALGVGIGFGLQNVVNNFVSGLILLFERPIQTGDVVEVGGITGEVRRIGIRASTVATADGADVLVPNGDLLSEKVVNWTLTNRSRRIEIPVGVAYGTRPATVLALLVDVARGNPHVMVEPGPIALFTGFGDSALTFVLRFWTLQLDHPAVRSAVAVSIYEALEAAAIGIPFPQQDLHVRSIAPGLLASTGDRSEDGA